MDFELKKAKAEIEFLLESLQKEEFAQFPRVVNEFFTDGICGGDDASSGSSSGGTTKTYESAQSGGTSGLYS